MLNSNLYLIRFITPKNIIFLSLFSLFTYNKQYMERLNWKNSNNFRIHSDFMKPYQIQMPFFPSLTYTHHFHPTIIILSEVRTFYYILFFNWSISIFKSIASSISPLSIHLTHLLFKFLILVSFNTFSCCLFI